jgi:hypothetical protein
MQLRQCAIQFCLECLGLSRVIWFGHLINPNLDTLGQDKAARPPDDVGRVADADGGLVGPRSSCPLPMAQISARNLVQVGWRLGRKQLQPLP